MIKKILIGLASLLALFLIFVAAQPGEYKISRELAIKATPETLFPYINNAKKAEDWMPWKDSDPKMTMKYTGPEEGVGSTSAWESEGDMGVGQATVIESIPLQSVSTQLIMQKPMAHEQVAKISLTPSGEATVVTWSVTGHNGFLGRLFCVFMNMDEMVGKEFEKGLATLKAKVEGAQ